MTEPERFLRLLRSGHRCIFMPTFEEREALELINEAALEERVDVLHWSASHGLRDPLAAAPIPDTSHPAAAFFHLAALPRRTIAVMCDAIAHLKDDRTLRVAREAIAAADRTASHLVFLDHIADLPPVLRSYATPFEPALPDEADLEKMIRATARELAASRTLNVTLTRRDLDTLVRNLAGLSLRHARQVILDVADDGTLDADDINASLARKRRLLEGATALEYVESPVSLDEIGGLNRLKSWLSVRREALCPEAAAQGIDPPRGLLMLGVQGAGKSLSAKAVATAWQRPLLRLDAGALYDRFVGESERRLRDALKQAEAMAPVILWIDEIEKAFASAAQSAGSADGGLSKRMFGTLLTWMQEHRRPVFLIATANDITALPPELLRKGRFDEIFFVDLPTLEARAQVFSIHLRKRRQDPAGFDLAALASASHGFSGAEIEQAIASALITAWSGKTPLTTQAIEKQLAASPPLSVTMSERIAELRAWSQGRCVPAD